MENLQEWAGWGLLVYLSLYNIVENRNSAWALLLSRISCPALGSLCQRAVTLPTVRETKALSSSHHPEIACCLQSFLDQLSPLYFNIPPQFCGGDPKSARCFFPAGLAWSTLQAELQDAVPRPPFKAQGTEAAAETGQSPLWPEIQGKCSFTRSQRQNLAKAFRATDM